MRATLKLFAGLPERLPAEPRSASCADLDLVPGTTVQDVIDRCRIPPELCALVLVNGVFLAPEDRAARVLAEGDTLAIWPPIGGG